MFSWWGMYIWWTANKKRNGEIQKQNPIMLIAGGILMGLDLLIWAITNTQIITKKYVLLPFWT